MGHPVGAVARFGCIRRHGKLIGIFSEISPNIRDGSKSVALDRPTCALNPLLQRRHDLLRHEP